MDDILYADSFVDLLIIDISDLNHIKLIDRLENVIDYVEIMGFYSSAETGFVTDLIERESRQVYTCDQVAVLPDRSGGVWLSSGASLENSRFDSFSQGAGLGGSLARFTLNKDFLYIVDQSNLHVFDISTREQPLKSNTVNLGWGIETIFPYRDHLFVGANNGMHILDNSDPQNPSYLSGFSHANACDPVAVRGDYAYVTLRSGNECEGFTNQLDVVNIKDIANPQLEKTYPMQNPHGLGIDFNTLFLCEGEHGLKVFDISDIDKIDQNQLSHVKGLSAFDVIPIDSHLMMIGENGLYQFDYSDPSNLKLLSIIPISQD
ncbi:MAG: LVIVD repeat-containing protein [Cyclobacteriaceae bacterium]